MTSLVNLVSGLSVSDSQSGFRAIRYDILRQVTLSSRFTYTQEELIACRYLGARITEVPVSSQKRKHGKSRMSTHLLKYAAFALADIARALLAHSKYKKQRRF